MLADDQRMPGIRPIDSELIERPVRPCRSSRLRNTRRWRSVKSGSAPLTPPGNAGWDMAKRLRSDSEGCQIRIRGSLLGTRRTALRLRHQPGDHVVGHETMP